jgi:hypothetical protein
VHSVHAAYTAIGPAVAAARSGDTVRVCGGRYREDIVIDERIDLVANVPAAPAVECTADAIVPPAALAVVEAREKGILVTASNSRVDGFVISSAENGIFTVEDGVSHGAIWHGSAGAGWHACRGASNLCAMGPPSHACTRVPRPGAARPFCANRYDEIGEAEM